MAKKRFNRLLIFAVISLLFALSLSGCFKPKYEVVTSISPLDLDVTIEGAGFYSKDTMVSFTAPNVEGYNFDHWEVNGVNVGNANPLVIIIDSPKNIVAVYRPLYTIEADSETHYTGKWSYITVTVKDSYGNPVENIAVSLSSDYSGSIARFYSVSTEKVSVDPIVYTDQYGVATFEGYFVSSGEYSCTAYLSDAPKIDRVFQVTVNPIDWLFLVYMGADNNLESAAYVDLGEMETLNNNVAVVGISDVSDSLYEYFTDDFYFWLDETGEMYTEDIGREVDSGSPAELQQFLEDFYSIEANHKALILWNHGGAWLDEDATRTRGIIYDDTSDTFLKIKEVQDVLETVLNGEKLDILGMDACLMSTVEVAYQLRNTSDYFVASAFSEPGDGWDYDFLDDIGPLDDAYDVAKNIVDRYFESLPYTEELSLSVWKMGCMDELYSEIDNFARELDQELTADLKSRILNTYYPAITQYYVDYYHGAVLCEIGDFIGYIYNDEGVSQDVKDSAYSAWVALDAAVPYSLIRGGGANSKGVSIFLPETYDAYNAYYSAFNLLDFWWNYWEILASHILN